MVFHISVTNEHNQTSYFQPRNENINESVNGNVNEENNDQNNNDDENIPPPIEQYVEQLLPNPYSTPSTQTTSTIINDSYLNLLTIPGAPPDFPRSSQQLTLTKIWNPSLKEEGFVINLGWDVSIQQHPQSVRMKQAFIDAAQLLVNIIQSKVNHDVICYHKEDVIAESSTSLFVVDYHLLRLGYKTSCITSNTREIFMKHNMPEFNNPIQNQGNQFVISDTQRKLFHISVESENITNSNLCFINLMDETTDLVGSCLHELTETLGRISPFEIYDSIQSSLLEYRSIMDLGNYIEENKHNVIKFQPNSYFSSDNGKTKIAYLNTNSDGDAMDWDSKKHEEDCFKAFSKPNVKMYLTNNDLIVLDILGFDLMPITYQFGYHLILPIHVRFVEPVLPNYFNSYHHLFFNPNQTHFAISPNLPDGLLFDSNTGSISGRTNEPISKTQFTVILYMKSINNQEQSNNENDNKNEGKNENVLLQGKFYITINSSKEYEMQKEQEKKLEEQKKLRANALQPRDGEVESTVGLNTADIVLISLAVLIVIVAIAGLGVFIHDSIKQNKTKEM